MRSWTILSALIGVVFCANMALAQDRGAPLGWGRAVDGLLLYQGETDLAGGGTVSTRRMFLRGGAIYRFENGNSLGVAAQVGRLTYDFSQTVAPWRDIEDRRITIPIRLGTENGATVFLAPSLRYDYERGANRSDGQTYGLFGGITWRVNDRLVIGPGFGAFTELGTDDFDVFPALLVDWKIDERWTVSTGTGLGASQGPGLSLIYSASDALSISLSARYEELRFRLDGAGIAPNGVGEERSVPIVITARYAPNPGISLTGFLGAEINGALRIENAAGMLVSAQDFETAPVAGFAFRLLF